MTDPGGRSEVDLERVDVEADSDRFDHVFVRELGDGNVVAVASSPVATKLNDVILRINVCWPILGESPQGLGIDLVLYGEPEFEI